MGVEDYFLRTRGRLGYVTKRDLDAERMRFLAHRIETEGFWGVIWSECLAAVAFLLVCAYAGIVAGAVLLWLKTN